MKRIKQAIKNMFRPVVNIHYTVNDEKITVKVRRYFALARELGYSGVDAKNAAKRKFNVDSFTELTALNVDELIEKAELVKQQREYERQNGYKK